MIPANLMGKADLRNPVRSLNKSFLEIETNLSFKHLIRVLGLSQFQLITEPPPKNLAHIKSGHEWHKNNYFASFTKVQSKPL